MKLEELRQFRPAIMKVAARRGVTNVKVFGSVARGDARPDSDVDLLIEVERGRSMLAIGGFLEEVSAILGRPVHVLEPQCLRPRFQDQVLREAVAL
ncbi:MAG: nucleotidyltransferase family protein [Candidatus Dormibacteria bacterium]